MELMPSMLSLYGNIQRFSKDEERPNGKDYSNTEYSSQFKQQVYIAEQIKERNWSRKETAADCQLKPNPGDWESLKGINQFSL